MLAAMSSGRRGLVAVAGALTGIWFAVGALAAPEAVTLPGPVVAPPSTLGPAAPDTASQPSEPTLGPAGSLPATLPSDLPRDGALPIPGRVVEVEYDEDDETYEYEVEGDGFTYEYTVGEDGVELELRFHPETD